jgi:catechol 2,3-dioxygenase-like lactoylglutathione lyase family enzyme
MIGHLGLNVDDFAISKPYYDALMPVLDFEPFVVADDEFAYRPANGKRGTYLFFYPSRADGSYSQQTVGLQHLAFMVPTRGRVNEVHDVVRRLGSEIVHPPQAFPQYLPPYFAVFWRDPNGFMLEAVCHHDRD